MWIFLVCFIPLLFFPPVSYSVVPLQSIDCFCSSRRLIASLLARLALVRRRSCSIVASSASVRRLFMLFYSPFPLQSVDCFCSSRQLIASLLASFAVVRRCFCCSSRPFRFSPSIVSALLVARSASVRRLFMLFSSINRFSSRQFRFSPSITSVLLID